MSNRRLLGRAHRRDLCRLSFSFISTKFYCFFAVTRPPFSLPPPVSPVDDLNSVNSIFPAKPRRGFNWAPGISIFVRCNMQSTDLSNQILVYRRLRPDAATAGEDRLVDKFYLLLVARVPLSSCPLATPCQSPFDIRPIKCSRTVSS